MNTPTPGIRASDTLAEAARKTLRHHFDAMLANEAGTLRGEEEALHDMRVATRRMRAACVAFEHDLDAAAIAPYRRGLKRAARALGRVRDLDVFRSKATAYRESLPEGAALDFTVLQAAWNAAYQRARRRMLKYLQSEDYHRFKTAFEAYLDQTWTGSAPARTVRDSVPGLLRESRAAVIACHRWLATAEDPLETYHQLRIAIKRLRYTMEYFREVLDPACEGLIDEAKRIQDHLGALQDAVVAREHLHNALAWGTWRAPRAEALQWATPAIVAPDVAEYLVHQQTLVADHIRSFPQVWERFESRVLNENLSCK